MGAPICRLDELADRECREFEWQDGAEAVPAFLLRLGDEVVAYRNQCPHTGVALNWVPQQFLSYDEAFIQCAVHGALFSLYDGNCLHGPCNGQSLEVIPLTIKAGVVSAQS